MARTRTPIVFVRAAEGSGDVPESRHVVLGLDLEHADASVIEFAFQAAARRTADLRVVHGWSLPAYYGYSGATDAVAEGELLAEAQRRLTDVLHPWREKFPCVQVHEQAVVGGAGPHLVDASRDAELVVVGRRHRQTPVGTHIGPVTQAVLHHSTAPVAVVPHE